MRMKEEKRKKEIRTEVRGSKRIFIWGRGRGLSRILYAEFIIMTYLDSWEAFEIAAEKLYLQDPMKVRYTLKYDHAHGLLKMKMTDDAICLQFKTYAAQDVKKMDKFVNNLMRHMASKERN